MLRTLGTWHVYNWAAMVPWCDEDITVRLQAYSCQEASSCWGLKICQAAWFLQIFRCQMSLLCKLITQAICLYLCTCIRIYLIPFLDAAIISEALVTLYCVCVSMWKCCCMASIEYWIEQTLWCIYLHSPTSHPWYVIVICDIYFHRKA